MIELLQTVDGLRAGWCGDLDPAEESRLICSGLARAISGTLPRLSPHQMHYFNMGRHLMPDGDVMPIHFIGTRVELSASGLAKSGASKLMYFDCDVGAGYMTIFDGLTASGRVVVDNWPLVVGRYSLGAALSTGCYVVLSDAAARVKLGFR